MRKTFALGLLIVVFIALGIAFVLWEAKRTPDWQIALDGCIQGRSLSPGTTTIRAVDGASKPWNFKRGMGKAVFDEQVWAPANVPFPPHRVMCVLLERSHGSIDLDRVETTYQVVFVSYHTDLLWQQDWIVYAGPSAPFDQAFKDTIAALGCNLELDRWKPDSSIKT